MLVAALALSAALAGCSSFSGFVADTWPTWAGGMPKDVPPRPGAPGYDEFIAHQQHQDGANAAAPAGGATAAGAAATAAPTTGPAAAAPATTASAGSVSAARPPTPTAGSSAASGNIDPQQLPPAYRRIEDDQSAVHGGLY